MKQFDLKASRRQFLTWSGIAGASLAMPSLALGQSTKTLTILHATKTPLLAWAPSYLAEALGYYKDEGFEVERIMSGSGPASLAALVSGSGTSVLCPPGELVVAISKGQDLKILMAQANYQAIHLVLSKEYAAKHGITPDMNSEQRLVTAKSFKGIRCGVTSPGSSTDYAARAALKGVGLEPGTDAEIVPLGSTPANMSALANGSIDAFTAASPTPEMVAAKLGAVVFLSVSRNEIGNYRALAGQATLARGKDIEANPETYAAVVRADTKAMKAITDDPDGSGETLRASVFGTMSKDVWGDVWKGNIGQFQSPYVTKDSVAAYISQGMVAGISDPKAVNLDKAIDMHFVDQAVNDLGWKLPG